MNRFTWMRAYFSPFKPPKIRLYIGKVKIGTPYFFPRKWVKITYKEALKKAIEDVNNNKLIHYGKDPYSLVNNYMGYKKAVPKKIGFDFIGLGWKTKWDDYRHEWSPVWSFVFFKWQIAIIFSAPHEMHYWESWLYYTLDTNKKQSIKERIIQCRKEAPQIWSRINNGTKETTDYYNLILKKKWL